MHYRNGREAKNGDKIVRLNGGKIALSLAVGIVGLTGCANAPKLARELAKDPATVSFSVQLVTPWGQQNVSFARSGTNNPASAAGGAANVNTK